MNITTIRHIILMPKNIYECELSFFQGFSRVLFKDYPAIFSALSIFPHDVLEIYLDDDDYIKSKMMGSSLDVYQIREELLDEEYIDFDRPFNVLWSTEKTMDSANRAALKFDYPPIHISTSKSKGAIFIDDLTDSKLHRLIEDFIKKVINSHPDNDLKEFLGKFVNSGKAQKNIKSIPFVALLHNCTIPLIKTLYKAGYETSKRKSILPDSSIDKHVRGITSLTELLDKCTSRINIHANYIRNNVIVYCPSFYTYLYKQNSSFWNKLYRELNKDRRALLKGIIIRNKGYSNGLIEMNGQGKRI